MVQPRMQLFPATGASRMTASSAVTTSGKGRTPNVTLKVLGSAAILVIALVFVFNYVLPRYLHYNEAAYNDAASNHWALRGWVLMHITGARWRCLLAHGSSGRDFDDAMPDCIGGREGCFCAAWPSAQFAHIAWR